MTLKTILAGTAATLMLTACASVEDRYNRSSSAERGAVGGALAGAAAGAIIAGEGDDVEGALIGAGVGAAGGYILGNERDKRNQRVYDGGYRQGALPPGIATDSNRYYDERTGRYYYRDPATGATYYANGERRT